MRKFVPPLLLAVIASADLTASECVFLDDSGIAGIMQKQPSFGGWVSDGEVLEEQWRSGMHVKALIYCISDQR